MNNMNDIKSKNVKVPVRKNNQHVVFLSCTLGVFLIILVSTVSDDVIQIYKNKSQTKEYTVLYNNLLEEEASLDSEVVKLHDPDYVARYAREKFLYTKDGEKILTILDNKQKNEIKVEDNK